MIAPDVRKKALTDRPEANGGNEARKGSAEVGETGRSSSRKPAGASPIRARRQAFLPLPPPVTLDGLKPTKPTPEPDLIITDEQMFAIQVLVAAETQQWEARSNISKVTHDSAMNAISNIK